MKPIVEIGELTGRKIRRLVGRDNPIIVEVGANVGQTTAEFLREMPNARIFCFEPDPRAIEKFKSRIKSPNVKLFECAVGNENGTVVFNQSSGERDEIKDWNQSGSIRLPKFHTEEWPWVKFEKQIEVQIVRLDDWARRENITSIDFIWADTQGAESDLINGGLSALEHTRFFYTEYGAREWYEGQISLDAICDSLAHLNFSMIELFQYDVLFENMKLKKMNAPTVEVTGLRRNEMCPCGSGMRVKHCHGASF